MDKNILFYSNNCPYSQRLINILDEEKIGHDIVRICVDGGNLRLPSFITCVPTIYLSIDKQVLTDDRIEEWINKCKYKIETSKLAPFCLSNNSFSDCFSFLNGEHNIPNYNYTQIGSNDSTIKTPREAVNSKKGVAQNYEKLLAERENEIKRNTRQRI